MTALLRAVLLVVVFCVSNTVIATTTSSTVQISFPSHLIDKDRNILGHIASVIPKHFPHLKLNTLGRRFHSTLVYLDDMDKNSIYEFFEILKKLPPEVIEKYQLDKTVLLIDPERIEFSVVGTQSKFLALKPHPEFVAWQMRFWEMLKEHAPHIYQKHQEHRNLGGKATSEHAVHISLFQWGEKFGLDLSPQEVESMKKLMHDEITKAHQVHQFTRLYFNPKNHNIQTVLPAMSLAEPPFVVSAFKVKPSQFKFSDIYRWREIEDKEQVVVSEYNSRTGKESRGKDSIMTAFRVYPSFDITSKQHQLLPQNQVLWQRVAPQVPESLSPSEMKSQGLEVYFPSHFNADRDPARAFEVFDKIKNLKFPSNEYIHSGFGLYASSLSRSFMFPGDYDLALNSLVYVPDSIRSYEQARDFATIQFNKYVFGHIKNLIKEGKLSLIELRIGSDALMYKEKQSNYSAYLEHPYLSEKEFLEGEFVDKKTGKVWSLDELLKLEDFSKAKLDYFNEKGERFEISLQFIYGFHWKGYTYSSKRFGIKVLTPLLRSMAFADINTYVISAALYRPQMYHSLQKWDFAPSMIHTSYKLATQYSKHNYLLNKDSSEINYTSKFIKRLYNQILILNQSPSHVDKMINESMTNSGYGPFDINTVLNEIRQNLNNIDMHHINMLKRAVNDFAEFSERKQSMRYEDQVKHRVEEIRLGLAKLMKIIRRYPIAESLKKEIVYNTRSLQKLIADIESSGNTEKAAQTLHLDSSMQTLKKSEILIALLESDILSELFDRQTKNFLQTYVRFAPIVYLKHLISRENPSDYELLWVLKMMNISITSERLKVLREAVNNDFFSLEELDKLYKEIYNSEKIAPKKLILPMNLYEINQQIKVQRQQQSSPGKMCIKLFPSAS